MPRLDAVLDAGRPRARLSPRLRFDGWGLVGWAACRPGGPPRPVAAQSAIGRAVHECIGTAVASWSPPGNSRGGRPGSR